MTYSITKYAKLNRIYAFSVLATFVVAVNWCVLRGEDVDSLSFHTMRTAQDDPDLYMAVAQRVRLGSGYYESAATELTVRGYRVHSVFNWRMPLYAWIFGKLPSPGWGRLLLAFFGMIATILAGLAASREFGRSIGFSVVGALIVSYSGAFSTGKEYNMEIWSGVFILIACMCYFYDCWELGVTAGVVALAMRELALPFCVTACLLAFWHGRSWEVFCWAIIFCVGMFLFWMHWMFVNSMTTGATTIDGFEWMMFGGTDFVLATCRVNVVLAVLPTWCASVYLPLSLLGLFGWRSRSAITLQFTALAYVFFFAIAGKAVNYYWGWVCMPLLVLGAARAPASLRDLVAVVTKIQ